MYLVFSIYSKNQKGKTDKLNRIITDLEKKFYKLESQRLSPKKDFFYQIDQILNIAVENSLLEYEIKAKGLLASTFLHTGNKNKAGEIFNDLISLMVDYKQQDIIKATAHKYIGYYFWNISEYDKALSFLEKSIKFSHNPELCININLLIGMCYFKKNDYDKSFFYLNYAFENRHEIRDNNLLADICSWYGILQNEMGMFNKALEALTEAVNINLTINNLLGFCSNQNTIGLIYESLGYHEEALKHFTEAEIKAKSIKALSLLADSHNNMAMIFQTIFDYDKAIQFYLSALKNRNEITQADKNIVTLLNISFIYLKKRDYKQSFKYLMEGYHLTQKYPMPKVQYLCFKSFAQYYMDVKNSDKAKSCIQDLYRLAYEINDKKLIKEAHLLFANYYEIIEDYKKSLEYTKLAMELNDQITNEEDRKTINNLRLQYENMITKFSNETNIQEEKIKAVIAMAVTANHEINQPLMLIQGNLDLLINSLNNYTLSAKQENYLNKIFEGIIRITNSLNKFKSTSNISFVEYMNDVEMVKYELNE